ncbi:MAG TPA: S8/S53 family peptidase [Chryseosolibacter sp.]
MKDSVRVLSLLLLLVSGSVALGQVNRYMVFFKDKSGTPYTTSQPLQFLSERAIERRVKQDITVTDLDLPVNPGYVQSVSLTGAKVYFATRWMNGVLIQCDASIIPSVQALPFVNRVEFVAPQQRLVDNGRRKGLFRKKNNHTGVRTESQLQMLGIPEMHADGFKGEGMAIALFDGGFQGVNSTAPFQDVFNEGRYDDVVSHDFVRNTDNVFQYDDHGTQVFSIIAANVADEFTGGAPKANFQLYVTEDASTEYRVEEYNWLFAAERADSAGVDIISSSLGYYDFDLLSMNYSKDQMDGKTAIVTQAAQLAAERGIIVVASAGNEGNIPSWRIITAPADAVDVVAVANVNTQGTASASSSRGPSADGRIKPDLAALGSGVTVVQDNGSIGTASGTSLAAPLITSLIAGVWQKFPDFSAKEIVAALKKTASRSGNPDNNVGYGVPSYVSVSSYLDREAGDEVFEIYPNPAFDSLTISPGNPDDVSAARIELISRLGQVLATDNVSFSWTNNIHRADISNLSAGIYFVRVTTSGKKYVYRIVKLR